MCLYKGCLSLPLHFFIPLSCFVFGFFLVFMMISNLKVGNRWVFKSKTWFFLFFENIMHLLFHPPAHQYIHHIAVLWLWFGLFLFVFFVHVTLCRYFFFCQFSLICWVGSFQSLHFKSDVDIKNVLFDGLTWTGLCKGALRLKMVGLQIVLHSRWLNISVFMSC